MLKLLTAAAALALLAGAALALSVAAPAFAAQAPLAGLPQIKEAFGLLEGRFIPTFDRYCALDGPPLPVALGKGSPATPSKLFDNLYYVGRTDVGAWVIKTSAGLVMIDTLYSADDARTIIEPGMRKLGLDPADLKIILLTHHHGDHSGGAKYFQDKGVRVMVSEADWGPLGGPPDPQSVLHDRQVVKLGDTDITVLLTPGHTPGTITAIFPAYEGRRKHMVALSGGLGPRGGVAEHRSSVEGLENMRSVAKTMGVDVGLDPHAVIIDTAAWETNMSQAPRSPGQTDLVNAPDPYQPYTNK
jgi:metallo-beta-lactamase class B